MAAMRWCFLGSVFIAAVLASGQATAPPQKQPGPNPADSQAPPASQLPPSEAPPRSDDATPSDDPNFSSSRANIIDLRPPKDDLKEHPGSAAAARATEDEDAADVREFHQWNPMRALKDVEVGDYYFKRKNYRGALERYKDALIYKENDAVATFRLAVCQEQLADKTGALNNYAAYLKILPHGPFAEEAQDSIKRLSAEIPSFARAAPGFAGRGLEPEFERAPLTGADEGVVLRNILRLRGCCPSFEG